MAKDRDNCLFCRIADHTVNSQLLYEDDLAAAFLDINPRAPQHVLIIPKKHIPSLAELKPEDAAVMGHLVNRGWRKRVTASSATAAKMAARRFRTCISTFWAAVFSARTPSRWKATTLTSPIWKTNKLLTASSGWYIINRCESGAGRRCRSSPWREGYK